MTETVTFDDSRFQAILQILADVVPVDAKTLLKDEMRLFLKQALNFTPPKTRAQGEQAIEDDLGRTFTGASEDFLLYEFGESSANIDQWFTNRNGEKVHAQFDNMDTLGRGMNAYHQSQRNARGRSGFGKPRGNKHGENWKARYVVGYEALTAYKARVKARVGMMKSGLGIAYAKLGGKLPDWVSRHIAKQLGTLRDNLDVPNHPSIVVTAHPPGIVSQERILTETFRARREAIAKRIRLIVSGYSQDVKNKIKIRTRAAMQPD